MGRERHEGRAERSQIPLPQVEALLGQHHDAASLRSFVGERRQLGSVSQLLLRDPGRRQEGRRLAIAERDGPRLVQQQHIDVPGRLHGPARGSDDVCLHHPAHARDADRRQEAADRCRNETDEKGYQRRDGYRAADLADLHAKQRERQQRHDHDQKHERQRDQQDRQRDLIRSLLSLRGLDHRDHPVEERFARIDCHAHDDPVRQDLAYRP